MVKPQRDLPSDFVLKETDHWRCTTSSSCKRSCLIFFIFFQFSIICMLCITLRSWQNNMEPEIAVDQPNHRKIFRFFGELNSHPVFKQFNITLRKFRPKVNLLLIVSSAPHRGDRRMAIRETWWNDYTKNERVKVKRLFFTDTPDKTTDMGKVVLDEQQKYKDIVFQNLSGGVEFGKRFLYHLVWAMQKYDFDYFMRMDDDYFFCLERFLHELPLPMRKLYHWGYVHCVPKIVRPEESMILLSQDLVETFLRQDPAEIKGHPWADQMIATWVQDLKLDHLYNHDIRLHHSPPLKNMPNITDKFRLVCRRFIGVHGSYPEHMRLLWKLKEGREYVGVELDDYTTKCSFPQIFTWNVFTNEWRYRPKNLIDNPKWDTYKQDFDGQLYKGREAGQGL